MPFIRVVVVVLVVAYAVRMVDPGLRVQVVGNNIVVALRGYSYAVTYYKPEDSPSLLMRYTPMTT
jgi:hypothetical protein